MLKEIISEISQNFIKEAINSPALLEDMASMEKYMAESYNNRIFIELLQNADDSGSSRTLLTEYSGNVVFANNGRCFNEEDIKAICRSGASSKERGESIGYRGLGFKSTIFLSNEIIIFSDNTFFTFSKSKCSEVLKKDNDKIPTIRIPFLVSDISIQTYVNQLIDSGYSTIFIFMNANIDEFIKELQDVNNGYFLFLKNILECTIEIKGVNHYFKINREQFSTYDLASIDGNVNEDWLVIRKCSVEIAFKYKDGQIVPCISDDAVYHCYLPTYDKVAFPLKINGDFSTDPSRKHIIFDSNTDNVILCIANALYEIVQAAVNLECDEKFRDVLILMSISTSFSRINALIKEQLKRKLINEKWLVLNNGTRVTAKEYKMMPEWLDESEKVILRQKSKLINQFSLDKSVYTTLIQIDSFLNQYSEKKFTTDDFMEIMEDANLVEATNHQTYAKILANIIKTGKSEQLISGKVYDYGKIVVKTEGGTSTINSIITNGEIKIVNELREELCNLLLKPELSWFCAQTKLKPERIIIPEAAKLELQQSVQIVAETVNSIKPTVSKWRSAEKQCVELEKQLGNSAKDVSRKNVGYDVESITPSGTKRYIEVKLLTNKGTPFSITNNEYTAAHQYGDQYYICLIIQTDTEAKLMYICNPLAKLEFEKKVRQWEWICEKYYGEEYCVDMK